ncbi:MAG: V-type ATP synthase subunit B [Alphaproteobacteria bacterium]
MPESLLKYSDITGIIGDIIKVRVPTDETLGPNAIRFGDMAVVVDGTQSSPGQVIRIDRDVVSLQVFSGSKGFSTNASVQFLGRPMETVFSENILGRIFRGDGTPIDGGPVLKDDPKIEIGGPSVNPVRRLVPTKMVRTDIPMIDVFNSLVESQKIPIFSIAGEPYNKLLARIGAQTDADIVVFAGVGLIYDDYHFFCQAFKEAGVMSRTVMFSHMASDPVVEAILVPDMALAVAQQFAVEENKRVLVLITDMTAYADAMKEIGVSLEQIPANRGYIGDLYSQLARRYERACEYKGAGSVTLITVTTMPGDDVTHPVPDNTGYITEGQYYLKNGMLDPFGSLSRLKQHVVGKVTREDHPQLMNTMVRFYAEAKEAKQKKAMSFELSQFDEKLLKFGELFERQFMDVDVSLPIEEALDACWATLATCFEQDEVVMKQSLIDRYWPEDVSESSKQVA